MGGRVALSACIKALKLKPGDEDIIPGYTCVVVPNIQFSRHARRRMKLYDLSEEDVSSVIKYQN